MITELSAKETKDLLQEEGVVLLDTRETHEHSMAHIKGATLLPPKEVLRRGEEIVKDRSSRVVFYCASGVRSLRAAEEMETKGYKNLYNLRGGIEAWQKAGLPVLSELAREQRDRYSRQILLPEIGALGQKKLLQSSVLLVGAGGLGSPVALYLAAAGVGRIGIADGDKVELSNLQRQVIHTSQEVGESKALSAKRAIQNLNPDVQVRTYPERVGRDNVLEIADGYDVVVDGSDNFAARYLLADATRRLKQPLVSAAILGFEGQVSTFMPDGPCYRCLFPEPPPAELAPSCSENGILGSVAGLVGLLQANEVLKLLLQIGQPLAGRLLLVDALRTNFRELLVHQNPHCQLCHSPGGPLPDYVEFCRASSTQ